MPQRRAAFNPKFGVLSAGESDCWFGKYVQNAFFNLRLLGSMRNVHFMNRNNHLLPSARGSDFPTPLPGRAATHIDARIAAMRAGGMSARAIRRALGLSEAAATASGLLELGRWVAALASGGGASHARGRRGPGGPGLVEVVDAVARGAGIDRQTLIAPDQRQPMVRARQLVMYLIRELCPRTSLQAIGFLLGRDHTTVLYGCRRAAVLLRRDRAFRAAYQQARRGLIIPEDRSRG